MKHEILIVIPKPEWDSEIVNIVVRLNAYRNNSLISEIHPYIFFQLKKIFQILETLGSVRIEGNNTTLAEYIDDIDNERREKNTNIKEIHNIQRSIDFIEKVIDENFYINKGFLLELHKMVMEGLAPPPNGEGSRFPGELRKINVNIKGAKHTPPDYAVLNDYFDEFIKFINENYEDKDILLMIAVAHHRFAYIHPFDNGNGRVNRLLTYALLRKYGYMQFLFNPSAVFYSDRNRYYKNLKMADSLNDSNVLKWIEYFLTGLDNEMNKINKLLNKQYVRGKIIMPILNKAREYNKINDKEFAALKHMVNKDVMVIKSEELDVIGIKNSVRKSRFIKRLRDRNILSPITEGGRVYSLNLSQGLLRETIAVLRKEGFVSEFLDKNDTH